MLHCQPSNLLSRRRVSRLLVCGLGMGGLARASSAECCTSKESPAKRDLAMTCPSLLLSFGGRPRGFLATGSPRAGVFRGRPRFRLMGRPSSPSSTGLGGFFFTSSPLRGRPRPLFFSGCESVPMVTPLPTPSPATCDVQHFS